MPSFWTKSKDNGSDKQYLKGASEVSKENKDMTTLRLGLDKQDFIHYIAMNA